MERDKFLLLNLEAAMRAAEQRGTVRVLMSLETNWAIEIQLTDRGRAALEEINKSN